MEDNENIRIGIDVGGSSIKAALVDTRSGRIVRKLKPNATPVSFERQALCSLILKIVQESNCSSDVGVGFPAAVQKGMVTSPPTAHEYEGWVGTDLATALSSQLG